MIKTIHIHASQQTEVTVGDVITQGDFDAYLIVIQLGQAVTGTAVLRLAKPDGSWYDVDADVDGKIVSYMMEPDDYDQTGDLLCYVRLFDGHGGIYTPVLIRFSGVRGMQDGK